jgi:hypothetical protein
MLKVIGLKVYRGYWRGGRTSRVFHAKRDCHCKRLAKKGAACNICKSENHWSCCCDKRRSREGNVVVASYISEDEEQENLLEDIEEHVLIGKAGKESEVDKDEWFWKFAPINVQFLKWFGRPSFMNLTLFTIHHLLKGIMLKDH